MAAPGGGLTSLPADGSRPAPGCPDSRAGWGQRSRGFIGWDADCREMANTEITSCDGTHVAHGPAHTEDGLRALLGFGAQPFGE